MRQARMMFFRRTSPAAKNQEKNGMEAAAKVQASVTPKKTPRNPKTPKSLVRCDKEVAIERFQTSSTDQCRAEEPSNWRMKEREAKRESPEASEHKAASRDLTEALAALNLRIVSFCHSFFGFDFCCVR